MTKIKPQKKTATMFFLVVANSNFSRGLLLGKFNSWSKKLTAQRCTMARSFSTELNIINPRKLDKRERQKQYAAPQQSLILIKQKRLLN